MEVLIKIGDSGGSKDGQIIACKPDGWLIPGETMAAWIDGGKEPVVLSVMPRYLADRHRRVVNRARWDLAHTAAEMAVEYDISVYDAATQKTRATEWRAIMIAKGADTNWGYEDLKTHFALRIDSADPYDYQELVDRDQDTDHKALVTAKRRNKIDYSTLYDAAKLTAIADKTLRVDVDRTTVIPRTAVKPLATIEAIE